MAGTSGFLITVAVFLSYFVEALALLGLFLLVYIRLTPMREIALIRAGNAAAAVSLGGALLGFTLPLASVIAHSASRFEVASWGLVALVVQLAVFFGLHRAFPSLTADLEAGNVAMAGLIAAVSLGVGLLNAACMVP